MNLFATYNKGVLTLTPEDRDDWFGITSIEGRWFLYKLSAHGGLPVYKDAFNTINEAIDAGEKLT